ncbi:MAG: hypothetical protein ACOVQX_00400 [Legionella sp.]
MNKDWPTKEQDMHIAELIIEEYAKNNDTDSLGLFELVVNPEEKRMMLRLANWVIVLAKHFNSIYGTTQGDYVTRQVISRCIIQGNTLH